MMKHNDWTAAAKGAFRAVHPKDHPVFKTLEQLDRSLGHLAKRGYMDVSLPPPVLSDPDSLNFALNVFHDRAQVAILMARTSDSRDDLTAMYPARAVQRECRSLRCAFFDIGVDLTPKPIKARALSADESRRMNDTIVRANEAKVAFDADGSGDSREALAKAEGAMLSVHEEVTR